MNSPEELDGPPIVILPDDFDLSSLQSADPAVEASGPERLGPEVQGPERGGPGSGEPSGEPSRSGADGPAAEGLEPGLAGEAGGAAEPHRSPAVVRPSRRRAATLAVRLAGSVAALIAIAVLVTVVAFGLRRGFLTAYYPSPGRLSAPHAEVIGPSGLGNCASCHDGDGIARGCLGCHEEIAGQLAERRGFHDYLLRGKDADCTRCHLEHRGADHELVGPLSWAGQKREGFPHPHVVFLLEGRHRDLECKECHEKKLRARFALPAFPSHPRRHTHLGLRQVCASCHDDVHSDGRSGDCADCHGQDSFRPATRFDHAKHFPLAGAHERVPCRDCHTLARPGALASSTRSPFEGARGTRCQDCHDSPHRTPFAGPCEGCHGSPARSWAEGAKAVTPEVHALTGFQLLEPHTRVACAKCHDPGKPYEVRHAAPEHAAHVPAEDSCQACHADIHGGQFAGRHDGCLDCHDRLRFRPSRLTREEHAAAFPLLGAHARADCERCHAAEPGGVRRFVGTGKECRGCHEDPHRGQFARREEECGTCHDTTRFAPSRFGLEDHRGPFPLEGAHVAVPCTSCHARDEATGVRNFTFPGARCKTCHESPHGDQFARELREGDCTACHAARPETFALPGFDHARSAGYPLVGAHARAKCGDCHVAARPDGVAATGAPTIYRGTSPECGSCHVDAHRGQFRIDGRPASCDCHASSARWADITFDHGARARFKLDGAHVRVPCGSCHPRVRLDGGSEVIQFKPLGTACSDCHEVKR